MMSPAVVPRIETIPVPLPGGGRVRVRVCPLLLACCGVEVAAALSPLLAADPNDAPNDDSGLPSYDGTILIVAGTVTDASEASVVAAYASITGIRRVLAFGACTASGGPYWDSYSVAKGIGHLVPVDLIVPGCPPRPEALLSALSALVQAPVTT